MISPTFVGFIVCGMMGRFGYVKRSPIYVRNFVFYRDLIIRDKIK